MLHLNYGDELLHFFEDHAITGAVRPLVEAVRALAQNDRGALRNVAPEVRATAEIIYDAVYDHLARLPEKTSRRPHPLPKASTKRRSPRKRAVT
jgi:hypothetical protein